MKEKDELRLEYDNDAKYYFRDIGLSKDEALKADTIISFWTPYKSLLEKDAQWKVFKTRKGLEYLIKKLKENKNDKTTEAINKVNQRIEGFSKVCYSKGNYILLPCRSMNNQRYSAAEDRIDLTLYECFGKATLAKFFPYKDDLENWIKDQQLSYMFKGEVKIENINWSVNEKKPKLISEMQSDEIYNYLDRAKEFIEIRNKTL